MRRAPFWAVAGTVLFGTLASTVEAQSFRFGWRNVFTTNARDGVNATGQALDRQGNLYVAYTVTDASEIDGMVRKFSPLGVVLWTRRFDMPQDPSRPIATYGLVVGGNGTVYVSVGAPIGSSSSQACLVGINGATGVVSFASVSNTGTRAARPVAIALDSLGNVFQAGGIGSNARDQVLLNKWNPAGTLLFSTSFLKAGTSPDTEGLGMAVTPTRDVVVVGYTRTNANGQDALIARLRGTDGSEVWSRTFPGSFFGRDRFNAVVVDNAGDAYAVGSRDIEGSNVYGITQKVNGTTGAPVWRNLINVPNRAYSELFAVGFDQTGAGVLVGGESRFGATGQDLFVQKLNRTTGAQLFRTVVNGSGTNNEEFGGFAIDQFGQAYIAGSTQAQSSGALKDFLVARVGATGLVNWSFRYTPGFNTAADDTVGSLVMDRVTGHVYAAGDKVSSINSWGKVLGLFQAPRAVNDAYVMNRNTTLTIAAPGVMANDVWRQFCGTTIATRPSVGTLTLATTGNFTYTPPRNFTGTVTWTYRLLRSGLTPSTGTVRITVR